MSTSFSPGAAAVSASSVLNTTTAPLANGATFTGTWEKSPPPHVMVSCITDTTGTLYFDFSNDASRVLTFPTGGFKVSAGVHKFQTAVKGGRYFRLRFVNDSGSNQTYLELYSYYGGSFVPANAPINQTASIDQAAIFVRSTIPEDEIRISRRSGCTGWTKFGYRNGLLAASGEQTVWPFSNNFTPMTTASTFTIAFNNATDGLGTTGALSLRFSYIDASGLPATASHTLSNVGSEVTSFTGLGINRLVVLTVGSVGVNTNDITVTETTGGTNQAIIPALKGITQQPIFFNGSNHDSVIKLFALNSLRLTGGGASPRIQVRGWIYNRTSGVRYQAIEVDIDAAIENSHDITDPIGFYMAPADVLYFTADTDTNNTDINIRFSLVEYQRT